MKAPKPVNTRKIKIIEEFGFKASEVVQDEFDERGFVVLESSDVPYEYTSFQFERLVQPGGLFRTRILWPDDETRDRAMQAREDDFAEEVGPEAYAAILDASADDTRKR